MGDRIKRHVTTVGDLLDYIQRHNISRETPVVMERIKDIYFEKHGWTTVLKEGYHYNQAKQWNSDIDSGKYLDKEEYPLMTDDMLKKIDEATLNQMKDEFIYVDQCCMYDTDHFCLKGHY